MKVKFYFLVSFFVAITNLSAQNKDSIIIRNFFNEAFTNGKCYAQLDHLCNKIGNRISGSKNAAKAVEFAYELLKKEGFDSVWLQPVMVPHWVRGEKEIGYFVSNKKKTTVHICALGNSVATAKEGIQAKVVEVKNFDELKKLGKEKVEGNIVFFSRPFPDAIINGAYGITVDQRGQGPVEAAKLGAIGVVVRSMTHAHDNFPHTGATGYKDSVTKIPGCAISTIDADILSQTLKDNPSTEFYFKQNCVMLPDVLSYNVVAEIKGSEKPDEIILVGGHLDSWDVGTGAHDDGAGTVQSMEALRLFKATGIKPKRTLRCVLFMNEENGLKGGLKYAELAELNKEKHVAAIETDAGGFMPREIGIAVSEEKLLGLQPWQKLLAPYGIQTINIHGGGADIGPLKKQGVVMIGYHPDGQKYFDYHHTDADTFDKVNKRELQFGAVTLSGLMWLISEYGL
ncbi:MAG: peptidase M28 family protein [Bacteroidetes bacterium]|nr:peptidase M28 family protein [Bacteroidota bacterium]